MHYLPSVAGILLVDKSAVMTLSPQFVTKVSAISIGVYYAWSFFQEPLDTYGCDTSIESSTIPVAASFLVALSVGAFLGYST